MMQIKAIIADDEAYLIEHLAALLAEVWPDLVICGRARNGPEALALIEEHAPHLAFLDIRMPGLCGMQAARKIAGRCWVIFVTAYEHYAVNAFESGALDYLVKPISRDRLAKAVQRVKKQLAVSLNPPWYFPQLVEQLIENLPSKKQEFLQWIRVQHGSMVKLIAVDEVCYFQADNKYTRVITREDEALIHKPVKDLAVELDPNRFWRIHRSTIINVAQIDKVGRSLTGRGAVKLKDRPEILTVSRSYLHLFRQM